jgi:hypothetical protein
MIIGEHVRGIAVSGGMRLVIAEGEMALRGLGRRKHRGG